MKFICIVGLVLILFASALSCAVLPANEFDFGDHSDPPFSTLLASNGARTQDVAQFWLGDTQEPSATTEPDAKIEGQDELDDGLVGSTWTNDGFVLRFAP